MLLSYLKKEGVWLIGAENNTSWNKSASNFRCYVYALILKVLRYCNKWSTKQMNTTKYFLWISGGILTSTEHDFCNILFITEPILTTGTRPITREQMDCVKQFILFSAVQFMFKMSILILHIWLDMNFWGGWNSPKQMLEMKIE